MFCKFDFFFLDVFVVVYRYFVKFFDVFLRLLFVDFNVLFIFFDLVGDDDVVGKVGILDLMFEF